MKIKRIHEEFETNSDNGKLVLVQVGKVFYRLSKYIIVKHPSELTKVLDKNEVYLLRDDLK